MSRLEKVDKLMNDPLNQTYDGNERINMKSCPYQANMLGGTAQMCVVINFNNTACSTCPVDDKDPFNQLMEYIFHE